MRGLAQVFNSRHAGFCYEAGLDLVLRAIGKVLINSNPGGYGGKTDDQRGSGVFVLHVHKDNLGQNGNCDTAKSKEILEKPIAYANSVDRTSDEWAKLVAVAKKLDPHIVENYCPASGAGGPSVVGGAVGCSSGGAQMWADRCANVPRNIAPAWATPFPH